MSITASLSNALSGLTASSRAAEVISSNVANALTEGYGRRVLGLSSQSVGGDGAGVRVDGVTRIVNDPIIAERRLSDANLGFHSQQADFLNRLQQDIGLPGDPAAISELLAQFETSLIEASSRPDSDARLNAVLDAVQNLTDKFNTASGSIQDQRMLADQNIARQVNDLNLGLNQIADLNTSIRRALGSGQDANALFDQRQIVIDSISGIVPLRQVARDGGAIALFTTGGSILLEGRAATVGFTPVGAIVPQMSIGTGALSGLTVNGRPVSTTQGGAMAGGSLAGYFAVRDDLAVTAQAQLDAVARDLIERFADPAVDPTLAITDPGIFTDAGSVFNVATETGLSARLNVNSAVVPASGGALWHLRDGLGAAVPGNVGNAAQLLALVDALNVTRIPASGGFIGAARSAVGLSSDLASLVNVDLRDAEANTGFARSQVDTFTATELRGGVDSDYEMQRLLLIEQAYAANARVISSIDEMINTLLGI